MRSSLKVLVVALSVASYGQARAEFIPTPQSCPAPTDAQCLDATYSSGPCGVFNNVSDPNGHCRSVVKAASQDYKATQQTGAMTEKVFDTSIDDFVPAMPPPPPPPPPGEGQIQLINDPNAFSFSSAAQTTWSSHEEKAKMDAYLYTNFASDPNPYDRYAYRRADAGYAGWDMATCEEFVYNEFYDIERWIDTLNGCKGDENCAVTVTTRDMVGTNPAFPPGIARRPFHDLDGNDIYVNMQALVNPNAVGIPHQNPPVVARLAPTEIDAFDPNFTLNEIPKNNFYAQTQAFISPLTIQTVRDQLGDAAAGVIQDMLNELHRGSLYYEIGAPNNNNHQNGGGFSDDNGVHEGYFDEWEFHKVMNTRLASETQGERREYLRRSNAMNALLNQVTDDFKCAGAQPGSPCGPSTPNAYSKAFPGDTQQFEGDPFLSRSIYGHVADSAFASPVAQNQQPGSNLQNLGFDISLLTDFGFAQLGGATASPTAHILGGTGFNHHTSTQHPNPPLLGNRLPPAWAYPTESHAANGNYPSIGYYIDRNGYDTTPPKAFLNAEGDPELDCSSLLVTQPGGGGTPAPRDTGLAASGALASGGAATGSTGLTDVVVTSSTDASSSRGAVSTPLSGAYADRLANRGPNAKGQSDDGFGDPIVAQSPRLYDVCLLQNALIKEWNRKRHGRGSCLDHAKYVCDWSPKLFVDHVVTRNITMMAAAKESEYKWCKKWTGNGQFARHAPNWVQNKLFNVPDGKRSKVADVKAVLAQRQADFEKKFKTVPIKAVNDLGVLKADNQILGNSKFSGFYDYSFLWHVKVFQYTTDVVPTMCRIGGAMATKFKVGATIMSHDVTAVEMNATVEVNENNSGQAVGSDFVDFMGGTPFDVQVLNDHDFTIVQGSPYIKNPGGGDKPLLITAPFQAGPVTITISAGIEYSYGVAALFAANYPHLDPQHPLVCDPQYSAHTLLSPHADLGIWADADATILGFGAGVEVNLTLLGLEMPMTSNNDLSMNKPAPTLDANSTLDLTIHSLDGDIEVYIKALEIKVASYEVFKWNGLKHTYPIFRTPPVSLELAYMPDPIQDYSSSITNPTGILNAPDAGDQSGQ